jgi:hypothetical protein
MPTNNEIVNTIVGEVALAAPLPASAETPVEPETVKVKLVVPADASAGVFVTGAVGRDKKGCYFDVKEQGPLQLLLGNDRGISALGNASWHLGGVCRNVKKPVT